MEVIKDGDAIITQPQPYRRSLILGSILGGLVVQLRKGTERYGEGRALEDELTLMEIQVCTANAMRRYFVR
jgi:hypothetical protein